jgi:predicted RecB family endonuclease
MAQQSPIDVIGGIGINSDAIIGGREIRLKGTRVMIPNVLEAEQEQAVEEVDLLDVLRMQAIINRKLHEHIEDLDARLTRLEYAPAGEEGPKCREHRLAATAIIEEANASHTS